MIKPVVERLVGSAVYQVAHATLRQFLASLQLEGGITGDRSCILVANHQSVLDAAIAVEITRRLRCRFLTWAHPEVIRRAGFLRWCGALEASRQPEALAQLMTLTRQRLRSSGRPTMLWIFPEGRLSHRKSPIVPLRGALAVGRVCPDIPVVPCGIDYTIFRGFRPHASVVMRGPLEVRDKLAGLAEMLSEARRAAEDLSERHLPEHRPASFLHPRGLLAGRRSRDPWFRDRRDNKEIWVAST